MKDFLYTVEAVILLFVTGVFAWAVRTEAAKKKEK